MLLSYLYTKAQSVCAETKARQPMQQICQNTPEEIQRQMSDATQNSQLWCCVQLKHLVSVPIRPKLVSTEHDTFAVQWLHTVSGKQPVEIKGLHATCHIIIQVSNTAMGHDADQHCFRRSTISWNVGRFSLLK